MHLKNTKYRQTTKSWAHNKNFKTTLERPKKTNKIPCFYTPQNGFAVGKAVKRDLHD